jgi:hypothetical protein
MLQFFDTLTDDSGNALLGATVTVTVFPGGAAANIYSTNGTASPIATSTVAADITGQVSFYAPDGAYILTYAYKGTPYKIRSPVQLADPMAFVSFTDTGAANAYALTDSRLPAQLYQGLKVEITAANSCTGASTFNLNGTGNVSLTQSGGSPLVSGNIVATGIYRLEYDGTKWQLISVLPVTQALVTQLVNFQTPAEIAGGVTPTQYQYPAYSAFRYMQPAWVADIQNGVGASSAFITQITAALQTLFTLTGSQGYIAYLQNGIYPINSALTYSSTLAHGGIVLQTRGYGGGTSTDSQILITGSGYTALTVTGLVNQFILAMGGTGNACNGLRLGVTATGSQIVQLSALQDIRIYNLTGFGVQINDMFDCWFGTVSVQLCGSVAATLPAFAMLPAAAQCNMTVIDRLQVEQAAYQAVNIDSSCLSCTIVEMHSERAVNSGSVPTHILGGDSCSFITMYLTSTTNALVSLAGSNSYYGRLRVSGGNVQLNSAVNVTYQGNRIDNLICTNLTALGANVTPYDIYSASIGGQLTTNGQTAGVVRVSFSTIAGVTQSSGGSIELIDCQINSLPTAALVLLTNCAVANAATLGTNQVIKAWQTTFNGALTTTVNNGSVLFGYGCTFNGNLVGSAGGNAGVLDMGCNAAFGVTVGTDWFGAPNTLPAALAGWAQGTVRKNLTAGATTYAFSICTTGSNSGAGTWTNSVLP